MISLYSTTSSGAGAGTGTGAGATGATGATGAGAGAGAGAGTGTASSSGTAGTGLICTRSARMEETSMNQIKSIKLYSKLISIEFPGMNQVA